MKHFRFQSYMAVCGWLTAGFFMHELTQERRATKEILKKGDRVVPIFMVVEDPNNVDKIETEILKLTNRFFNENGCLKRYNAESGQ